VEEASNAMGLDGVCWRDCHLKIRRPSNYDLATSLMLGPVTPDPTMDITCLNLASKQVCVAPRLYGREVRSQFWVPLRIV
jgi:hypothetical protein